MELLQLSKHTFGADEERVRRLAGRGVVMGGSGSVLGSRLMMVVEHFVRVKVEEVPEETC